MPDHQTTNHVVGELKSFTSEKERKVKTLKSYKIERKEEINEKFIIIYRQSSEK